MKKRNLLFCFCLCAALCCALLSGCAAAPAAAVQPTAAPVPTPAPTPAPTPIPYAYMEASELYARLVGGEDVLIVDLQPEEYYASSGHISGALSTEAYPADSEALLAKLDAAMGQMEEASTVVLVDMAGKAGAHNAFDYYAQAGADPEKLYILEGGMIRWPYREYRVFALAGYETQYMSARDTRSALRHEEPLLMLDLRDFNEYRASHLEGSINVAAFMNGVAPDAYLVQNVLAAGLDLIDASEGAKVLLISATGGGDAAMACDFYASRGIAPERLFLLEGGMEAWPEDYAHYLEGEAPAAEEAETEPVG